MASTPYQYLDATGVVVPDTSALLQEVQTEYQSVFGQDLIVTPDTPQGLLITSETLARSNVVNNNAALANQINPNLAGGVFLDAVLALTGGQRIGQTQTVVTGVTVTGDAGTVIGQGSQAKTEAGDVFQTTGVVTIGSGGTATVNFQSVAYGPIPCAANALTTIITGVIGWETVNNTGAGVLGLAEQADQAARAYRQNTLAFQGLSLPAAITSALYAVPGVTSLTFQENTSGATATINGISMVSHSVYACVQGGTDTAVAAALLENKSSGSAWNGGTTVNVVEPASGQTYAVQYDRPEPIGILIQVTTPNGNEANIIQAVLDYAAGLVEIVDQNGVSSPLAGFVVGGSVSPFDIAGAVMAENPGIYISNLQIGIAPSGSLSNSPIAIGVNQIASTQEGYIQVVITG